MIYDDLEYNDRDLPLTFNFYVANALVIEERLALLGVPKARSNRRAKARLSLLAEAVRGSEAGKWISYSRWANFYSGLSRYYGTSYTYRRVLGIVDQAVAHGLIEDDRAKKAAHLSHDPRQSRFRATPALIKVFRGVCLDYEHHDPIRLRDAKGRLQPYDDTPDTEAMRAQVEAFNAYLSTIKIQVTANDIERQGRYIIVQKPGKKPCYVPEGPARLQRTFNRSSFDLGGRFYGWWQNLPKEVRSSILLNGKATTELDYGQLHAKLLYAEKGTPMDMEDAYIIPGFTRDEGKLAFQVAVNAPTTKKAIGAVQHELKCTRSYAAKLIRAIKAHHPKIKDMFCSDSGVRLMKADSEIMADVMEKTVEKGVPFLPVHDCTICIREDAEIMKKFMIESISKKYPTGSYIVN